MPTRPTVATPPADDGFDYLAGIAMQLAARVREDDPDLTVAWLLRRVAARDWPAFALVLASHIDIDRSPSQLLAWRVPMDAVRRRELHAEFNRLRAKGVPREEIPAHVQAGETAYQAAAKAAQREGAA